MATLNQIIGEFNRLSTAAIREAWLPRIYDVAYGLGPRMRSWFWKRIPKSSEGIEGLTMNIAFLTQKPWSWRGMTEHGYTPTGGKFNMQGQSVSLNCCAAAATISHTELTGTEMKNSRMRNLLNTHMQWILDSLPLFQRALVWSPQSAGKAMGVAASASGATVTLDNDGLWHTSTKDRTVLFERNMVVQTYTSAGVKRGAPTRVASVNAAEGKVIFDDDRGFQDGDYFVPSDLGGLDIPGVTGFAGLPDILDDSNSFQGIDRSDAANAWARAYIEDADAVAPSYGLLSKFFEQVYNPAEAFTAPAVVRCYFEDEIRSQVRFSPSKTYEDGFQYVEVDGTKLYADYDCPRDRVIVPDFDNLQLATLGEATPLFDMGWQQIQGRPLIEQVIALWQLMYAKDCQEMGVLEGIDVDASAA